MSLGALGSAFIGNLEDHVTPDKMYLFCVLPIVDDPHMEFFVVQHPVMYLGQERITFVPVHVLVLQGDTQLLLLHPDHVA